MTEIVTYYKGLIAIMGFIVVSIAPVYLTIRIDKKIFMKKVREKYPHRNDSELKWMYDLSSLAILVIGLIILFIIIPALILLTLYFRQ